MKGQLVARVAQLGMEMDQLLADVNVKRGQKVEAEAMLQYLLRAEAAVVTPVVEAETVESETQTE